MGYSDTNAALLCHPQGNHGKRVYMAVDGIIAASLKNVSQTSSVWNKLLIGRGVNNPPTQSMNLILWNMRRITVNQKIKPELIMVNGTKKIHDDALDAATYHLPHNMSNFN